MKLQKNPSSKHSLRKKHQKTPKEKRPHYVYILTPHFIPSPLYTIIFIIENFSIFNTLFFSLSFSVFPSFIACHFLHTRKGEFFSFAAFSRHGRSITLNTHYLSLFSMQYNIRCLIVLHFKGSFLLCYSLSKILLISLFTDHPAFDFFHSSFVSFP